MRFSVVLMAYFVTGALMWGGGVIVWEESGVGQIIIDQDGDSVDANETTSQQVEDSGGPIQEAADTVSGGGLIAVWNIVVRFFGYLFWPITVLTSVGAPTRVVVIAGGVPTLAMLAGVIRMIRSGA